jgi:hypothetical protein
MKKIISVIILIVLAILFFVFIYKPETPEQKQARIDMTRRKAYDYAVKCSNVKPELKYQDITWIVVPGRTLEVYAEDGFIELAGYFNPADSVIYVAGVHDDTFWVLAHESMHAIGFRGHPDEPFRRCRLLAEQH